MHEQIFLSPEQSGLRLDVALAANSNHSRSYWSKRLKEKQITLKEQALAPNYLVRGDEVLDVAPSVAEAEAPIPELKIIYEDQDLLIVDKPADLLVHAVPSFPGQPTVAAFAAIHTTDPDPERPGIVHRLDRDTSGLLVIAKSAETKKALQAAFKEYAVQKTYLALVTGDLQPDHASVDLPIARKPGTPTKRAVISSGKRAQTTYTVIAHFPGYTYVEAKPQTGRTHQLRVHFAALGHPIAGDSLYGATKAGLQLTRHFLHATRLEFNGPHGQHITATSSLPQDLAGPLETLHNKV